MTWTLVLSTSGHKFLSLNHTEKGVAQGHLWSVKAWLDVAPAPLTSLSQEVPAAHLSWLLWLLTLRNL